MAKVVRGSATWLLGLLSTCIPLFAGVPRQPGEPTNDHKAAEPVTISNLKVIPGRTDFEIVISETRTLVPSVTTLAQPSRFVLDFPTVRPALNYDHLDVYRNGVKAIRIGRHENPLSTRIVFDLAADVHYSLSSSKDGVMLTLSRVTLAAKAEAPQDVDTAQPVGQNVARESQSATSSIIVAPQSAASSDSITSTSTENSAATNRKVSLPVVSPSESGHDDGKVVRVTNGEVARPPNYNAATSIHGGNDGAAPPDFKVGPEDVLMIDVWKEQELSKTVPIRPDGKISLPLVGDLIVAGMTTSEIRDAITNKLKDYMSTPEVSVAVQTIKSQYINVVGQVLKPGSYPLTKQMTVLDALALAGGFKDFAKIKKIYVLRPTPDGHGLRFPFDYKQVIKGRKFAQNINLELRDTVVVP